jgi:SPP1 gp7 family putative phage head morphogenesis protein
VQIDLAELVRRVGKYRRAAFTAPEIKPTRAQESDLLRIYMRVVRGWQQRFRETILPEYERALSELITDDAGTLNTTIGISERQMTQLANAAGLSVDEWIRTVETWHRKRFAQAFNPTGVNVGTLLDRNDVNATLAAVLGENTALIRSLDDQMRNGISGAVFRGLQARTPARDLAREVRRVAGVGQSRAELIAADQLQKLTGALDEQRQKQAGIDKFQWAHSGKAKPRPEHVARDGKIYAWTDPVAQSDPPGRAIRCGCRARAVLELDDEAEAATEPTPAPAPPPPPPPAPPAPAPRAPRGFRSPVNRDVTDDTVQVGKRLTLQKAMTAQFAEAASDARYATEGRWRARTEKDNGRASFSAAWSDEAVSVVHAVKPELDDLADQIGIPRLRGFKTTNASQNADMGGGIMGLNPAEFNARSARVGGGGGAADIATAARQQSDALLEQQQAMAPRIQDLRGQMFDARGAGDTVLFAQLRVERDALVKQYESLYRKRKKLSTAAGRANRVAATPETTWRPGDPVASRPWSAAQYYPEGMDRARSTLFHEFAHHVHQQLKREGRVRPLETKLHELWRQVPIGRDREAFLSRQPSTYGTSNQFEWFAESFSLFVMGKGDLIDPLLRDLIEGIFRGEF